MITQNDPRRWKERADGSMISEDRGAVANLSPNVIMREIPHNSIAINPSEHGNLQGVGNPSLMESLNGSFFGAVTKKGRL